MALVLQARKNAVFVGGNPGAISLTSGWTTGAGGATYTPVTGDVVYVAYAVGSTSDVDVALESTGYTELVDLYANGTSYDANLAVFRKVMGGTPDTTLDPATTGSAANAGAVQIEVWSGVDTTTPEDVTTTTATGTGTGRPNPPSITPTTTGAVVSVFGAGAAVTGAAFTQSGSELTGFLSNTSPDNVDAMIGGGHFAWTSGAFDPVAWTGGTNNAADSWAAASVAIRPSVTNTTMSADAGSYALTGTAATLTYTPVAPPATVALLGTPTFNTTAGNKTVTATPAVGDLILLVVASTSTFGTQTMSVSDTQGGTYSLVNSAVTGGGLHNVRVYARAEPISSASSTDFTVTTAVDTGGGIAVLKVTGIPDLSIRQTAKQDDQPDTSPPAPTFGGNTLADNPTVGVILNNLNPASLTPPTGWTNLVDVGYSSPTTGLDVIKRDGGFVGTAIPYSQSGFTFAAIILEIGTDPALIAIPGVYTLTGTDATLTEGGASSYSMPADPGSFSLTGTVANLLWGHVLVAVAGTYALTGTAVIFQRTMVATPGSYAVTGTATGLLRNRLVTAVPGSYALTGTAASLLRNRLVAAVPGSYTLTGTAAGLRESAIVMDAVPGSYAMVGTAATLSRTRVLVAEAGSYSLTGTDASLLIDSADLSMPTDPGSYALTGTAAGLVHAYPNLVAVPGAYAITGTPANFLRTMVATAGSYALTGTNANLLHGWTMPAVAGSYAVTGTQADLEYGQVVVATPGSYSLSGATVSFGRTYQAAATPGNYLYTGTEVIFPRDTSMVATAGSYSLAGTETGFRYWRMSPVPGVYVLTGWSSIMSTGTLADLVPDPDPLIVFRHNEPEVVRVPKLNAVARQAALKQVTVLSMAELATIGPEMGLHVDVWNAPGGYAPAYADGFNWRKLSDDTVLI